MVKYMHFLGFDPAYKSLAWSYMSINVDLVADIAAICAQYEAMVSAITAARLHQENLRDTFDILLRMYCTIETCFERFIVLHNYGVIDTLCGQKVSSLSEIERTRALCAALCGQETSKIWPEALMEGTTVVVEHQPPRFGAGGVNDVVSVAARGIVFRYCQGRNDPIVYIDPKCKNNINVGNITFGGFLAASKSKRKYIARKQHTRAMLIQLCKDLNIDISGVPNANLDDLADSFMSVIAHCLRTNMLNLAPLNGFKLVFRRLIADINALLDIMVVDRIS